MQTQVKALESIRGRVDAAQRVQQAEATSSAAEKEIASLKATLKELQGQRNRAVKAAEAAKAATRTAKATAQRAWRGSAKSRQPKSRHQGRVRRSRPRAEVPRSISTQCLAALVAPRYSQGNAIGDTMRPGRP